MILLSTNNKFIKFLFFALLLFCFNNSFSQTKNGTLKGNVIDGSNNKKIFNAKISHSGVSINTIYKNAETDIEGNYILETDPETYTITYSAKGFQTKIIEGIIISENNPNYLDVVLYPLSNNDTKLALSKDSLNFKDTVKVTNFRDEKYSIANLSRNKSADFHLLTSETIKPGIAKNTAYVLKSLSGVVVLENPRNRQLQTLNIRGLGERYNQVLLNGALFNSFDASSRMFAFDFLPTEIINNVSVIKNGNAHTPGDFSGGSININTNEFPEKDFIYALGGSGFSQYTIDKDFLVNQKSSSDFFGFGNKNNNLPADFPNYKSEFAFNQLNIQEQVRVSKTLNNNITPTHDGNAPPNSNFIFGYGKTLQLNDGKKLGLIAYIKHNRNILIEDFETQALPNVANNRFPFNERILLVKAQSVNTSFINNSSLGGFFNATLAYNKSKISFKNILGSLLVNNSTVKQYYKKYDESIDGNFGINFLTDQKQFWNSQLSGTHGLGDDSNFKLNWTANYSYYKQNNPDERNFLLNRNEDKNEFELANNTFDFTNSGRKWTETNEKSFFGDINIQIPFNLLNHAQLLSGGINIQSKNKLLFTDLLMYTGKGFVPINDILDPERYYQNGLTIANYFIKDANLRDGVTVADNSKGNYTASSNIGASYLKLESKITNNLTANVGLRLETSSNLISNVEYRNTPGFKFPQIYTMNENSKIVDYNLLPSLKVNYKIKEDINVYTTYFRSINRPQLQELSQYRSFDVNASMVNVGNPLLSLTTIDNLDLGINVYKLKGTSISLAGFYKRIDQPIENVLTNYRNTFGLLQSSPFNMPTATLIGIEYSIESKLDFISKRLKNLSFFTNANYVKSKVERNFIRNFRTPIIEEHTLSGSPNYSINAGLTYNQPKFASLTVLYNTTGDYVTAVGSGTVYKLANGNSVKEIPDYIARGTNRLDLQISKKLLKSKAQIIFGVNNVLNQADVVYQDLNGNNKFDKPVKLTVNLAGEPGYLLRGVDNVVFSLRTQPMYYLTFSYTFY